MPVEKEQAKQKKCRYCINEIEGNGAECIICSKAACSNCCKPNKLLSLNKHSTTTIPQSSFSKNEYEQKILKDYLNYLGITDLKKEILKTIVKDGWKYKGKELKPSDILCEDCFKKVWNDLLYEYRKSVNDSLPKKVKKRSNCWYGKDCKTQVHNQDHAKKYNHVCLNTKT
jgi:hypothetical protein